MGKVREPKILMVDDEFAGSPEIEDLRSKGHEIVYFSRNGADIIISPKAQMTPVGRLAYVVKKLKEIVKEVNG